MRIVFMGTGEIALPTLRWLLSDENPGEVVGIYTQPDKKIGRKQVLVAPEVKQLGIAAGIEVIQPGSLRKEPESIEKLRELGPDLIVVMAYGQILPRTVLELPPKGCVNLHASLLPRHRGASPIQAAIRDGDEISGITLMHVVPKLDAGDMILKETTPILPDDTGGSLHDKLADLGPRLLARGLPLLAEGTASAEPQDESQVTYAGKLERDDGVIDWNRDASSIERLIRAYAPWPGTTTSLDLNGETKKLKIFPPVEVIPGSESAPGTLATEGERLIVSCGQDQLALTGDLQLEGRTRLPVADFLRGTNLPSGTVLGEG